MTTANNSSLEMLSCFVRVTQALENTRLTLTVLPTAEYRYTAAEYALADASVKQNSLYSSPPICLGIDTEDSGLRSSSSFHHSCCCNSVSVSSQSNSCFHSS